MISIARPLSVFVHCASLLMCFRVRLAFLTATMRVVRLFSPELSYCVIAIRLPHVTSHLLLDCSLFRFLISFVHFIPSFENTTKFINTQKNDYIPTLVLLPVFGPFVTAVLTR
jgi:hypothetical protein